MNKLILLAIPIIALVILMGCAKEDTVTCNSPYIKVGTECCLDQNSNNICDSDDSVSSNMPVPDEKGTVDMVVEEQPKACTMEWAPVCGVDGKTYGNKCTAGDVKIAYEGECKTENTKEQPSTVEVTLAGDNEVIGYLPSFTTVNGVSKGNYVEFDQSKIEILGVWNNAISVRVYGAYIGETFTVPKKAPVDVNTKDGRIRMDFKDNLIMTVEKVEE